MDDLLQDGFDARPVVVGLFILGGFGLGPGSDVSRTSPSRGEQFLLWVGNSDVSFRLVPHFALGPITDVSNPAPSGRDSLVVRMNDVNRRFDVRGRDVRDIGVTSPACRVVRVRLRVFRNNIDAALGLDTVSAPSSFQADTVVRPTRSR